MRKIFTVLICLSLVLTLFCGCGKKNEANNIDTASPDTTVSTADTASMDFELTDRDTDSSYVENGSAEITLNGSSSSISGNGASKTEDGIRITSAGTYILSGALDSGMLTVDAGESDKIQMVFDGVELTNKNGPAVYIKNADKVFITLADGSENCISDGDSYTLTDDDSTLDGAVFSRADLTFNGTGALTVNGNCKHGIVSKDDLVISGCTLTVNAQNIALNGKDCVKTEDATLNLNAGSDGIRSDNTEDADRGYISLVSSNISITAENDSVQAETVLKTEDCKINIKSGGGSANSSTASDGGWNDRWMFGGYGQSSQNSSEESGKGLKASSDIIITSGSFIIDSADDCIHSNGTVTVSGGDLSLSSGDDGIHADTDLAISGGTIDISKSYEGLESSKIVITGGNISLVASDDGLNAAGGNDSSAMGGRPGQGHFSSSTGSITITGGYLLVNASGDGIDSNGTLTISGGTTLVSGPTNNGNGAFDYDSSATVTGGILIALGSNGMAQGFTDAENQGAMLCSFSAQSGGTSFAVCDENGKVIVSFTPSKAYQSAVVTAPGIQSGNTYTLVAGAKVSGADSNGFAENSTKTGGTELETVEMTSDIYGSSSGMGGMGGHGGMGGGRW